MKRTMVHVQPFAKKEFVAGDGVIVKEGMSYLRIDYGFLLLHILNAI